MNRIVSVANKVSAANKANKVINKNCINTYKWISPKTGKMEIKCALDNCECYYMLKTKYKPKEEYEIALGYG